ncbi:hypothetical protein GCM10007859_14890 [Brevundimonas denitrificans]|uniref:Uncharacterized protein n=1 Tax=Brevundimonas denitrificans TaxID=1443434 RepID=A0ABQ6BJ67_9CAUL|nr:hypothetical protein [Brevundimonas denitrificans]GLS01474.1 hypothetical protein GCM10007859_14890 [Brevundimonas denitrificans]
MTPDVFITVTIPVAVAAVLGLVLFGGRLRPETRRLVERAMAGVFYPLITVFWLWRAYDFAIEGREFSAAMMVVVAAVFGWMGVKAVRTGRLAPMASPTP